VQIVGAAKTVIADFSGPMFKTRAELLRAIK